MEKTAKNSINSKTQKPKSSNSAKRAQATHTPKTSPSVFSFMRRQADWLRDVQRTRCSETMLCTLRSFMLFRGGNDLSFRQLTSDTVLQYEAFLQSRGLMRNSTSFYMRNLRAGYRAAVNSGYTCDLQPFRSVYTGVDRTAKRAISIGQLRQIRRLDLSAQPALAFARDMLLLSFYLRGISFIDLAYLGKRDLQGNRIVYQRRKTRQRLSIELTPEARAIIGRYPSATRYLLPIITREDGSERRQYKSQLTSINRRLKRVGQKAALPIALSTYVMRHSWATIARDKGIRMAIISQALGHSCERTTQIYLDSISVGELDRANRIVLDAL